MTHRWKPINVMSVFFTLNRSFYTVLRMRVSLMVPTAVQIQHINVIRYHGDTVSGN